MSILKKLFNNSKYIILKRNRFNELKENEAELYKLTYAKYNNIPISLPYEINSVIYYIYNDTYIDIINKCMIAYNNSNTNKFALLQLTIRGFLYINNSIYIITNEIDFETYKFYINLDDKKLFTDLGCAIRKIIEITDKDGGPVKVIK